MKKEREAALRRGRRKTMATAKRERKNVGNGKVVLVGTYKGDQLTKWRGWYNYPISAKDRISEDDAAKVNELWLFKGTTAQKNYKAEFVGIKTRNELVEQYGYHAKGKAHGDKYLLYKTEFKYQFAAMPPEDAERVIIRTSDFATSPKVRKQLKAYLESPDRNDPDLAKRLPEILTRLRPEQLRVCEASVQLDFWPVTFASDECAKDTPICVNTSFSISFHNDLGTLYLGDSLAWLKNLPTASVDLIFADPPYSIGKAKWDVFTSHEDYLKWSEAWIAESSRILTDKGTCYICGFSEILADVKYRTQHFFSGCRWIVWHYKNKANLGSDWGRSHESLLHFRKAKSTVLNVDDIRIPYSAHTLKYPVHPQSDSSAYGNGKPVRSVAQWRPNEKGAKPKDVFDIPTTCNGMGEKTPHPTQKPEELVRKLVLASSHEGDLVLDPFSGSGTTAVVAQQLHRRWLACDRDAEYNQWAARRITQVPNNPIQYWINLDREVCKRRESIR